MRKFGEATWKTTDYAKKVATVAWQRTRWRKGGGGVEGFIRGDNRRRDQKKKRRRESVNDAGTCLNRKRWGGNW